MRFPSFIQKAISVKDLIIDDDLDMGSHGIATTGPISGGSLDVDSITADTIAKKSASYITMSDLIRLSGGLRVVSDDVSGAGAISLYGLQLPFTPSNAIDEEVLKNLTDSASVPANNSALTEILSITVPTVPAGSKFRLKFTGLSYYDTYTLNGREVRLNGVNVPAWVPSSSASPVELDEVELATDDVISVHVYNSYPSALTIPFNVIICGIDEWRVLVDDSGLAW